MAWRSPSGRSFQPLPHRLVSRPQPVNSAGGFTPHQRLIPLSLTPGFKRAPADGSLWMFRSSLQWRATQIQIPQTAVCGCFISAYNGEQHKIRIPQTAVCGNFTPTYRRRKRPDPNAIDIDGVCSLDGRERSANFCC
jgi:hypothetical protein